MKKLLMIIGVFALFFTGCSKKPAPPKKPDYSRIQQDAQKAHKELDKN